MSVKKWFRNIVKRNSFLFSAYVRLTTKEYQDNLIEFRNFKRVNSEKVNRELSLMKKYWKCYPTPYIRHKLFKEKLSDQQLLDYIPAYHFYVKHLESKHSGINRTKVESKLTQYFLFNEKDIPTPKVCGVIKNSTITDLKNAPIDIGKIIKSELVNNNDKLFIKPLDGAGGKGIFVLEKNVDFIRLNNKKIALNDLVSNLNKGVTYVIQRGIKQRSDISEINPYSVNTLRVIAQDRNGVMEMRACVMRIGRNKSFVDNSAQGGISVKIDIETGEMNKFATAEHGVQSYFKTHPDTNFVFEGTIIKDWYKIKSQISDICNKLSEFKDIALDIAITDNEVELIELNFKYGIDHLQTSCGGMRRVLNIYPEK